MANLPSSGASSSSSSSTSWSSPWLASAELKGQRKPERVGVAHGSIEDEKAPINWLFSTVLAAVHLGALGAVFSFSWSAVAVFMVLTFLTNCIGVSVGMHRLFCHRSFKVARPCAYLIGLLATLAFQGPLSQWVARHRMHHRKSDSEGDPHNAQRGFFHAHVGWLIRQERWLQDPQFLQKYCQDIYKDPMLRLMSAQWFFIGAQLLLALLMFCFGGVSWVVWGIFVRLVFCYHCTWLVNSAAHMWGYKTYPCDDEARNNWWVALLSWGEGWHNNHHAHPYSARIGHSRREIDVAYYVIALLAKLRLAWDLKLPGQSGADTKHQAA